jgi:hypothetical protein
MTIQGKVCSLEIELIWATCFSFNCVLEMLILFF